MVKQINNKKRDLAREREVLSKPIDPTGAGEDEVVKAVLSDEFVTGSNEQAFDIALALQQLIRGQASMLENQQTMSDDIAKLKQRMAEVDKAAVKWDTDRESFLADVMDKADKLRLSGSKLEELRARELKKFQTEVKKARVGKATERIAFVSWLAKQPKVTVVSPGVVEVVTVDGVPSAQVSPEIFRVRNLTYVLKPGEPTELPEPIAEAWKHQQSVKAGAKATEQVFALDNNVSMGQRHNQEVIAQKLADINQQYHTKGDRFPLR